MKNETPAYTRTTWAKVCQWKVEADKQLAEHRRTVALEKLAKVSPEVIKGTSDGDQLKKRKARANARKKRKVRHEGDRKAIRAEYAKLSARPGMTATETCEQLATQAQAGRAGSRKLSMKYDTLPTCVTRFDIRRIATATD